MPGLLSVAARMELDHPMRSRRVSPCPSASATLVLPATRNQRRVVRSIATLALQMKRADGFVRPFALPPRLAVPPPWWVRRIRAWVPTRRWPGPLCRWGWRRRLEVRGSGGRRSGGRARGRSPQSHDQGDDPTNDDSPKDQDRQNDQEFRSLDKADHRNRVLAPLRARSCSRQRAGTVSIWMSHADAMMVLGDPGRDDRTRGPPLPCSRSKS